MPTIKKQFRYIFGLFSISILLAGILVGLSVKEKNNSKQAVVKIENQTSSKNPEVNSPKQICKSLLEEDENAITMKEYGDVKIVDCVFVGCGGIF